jgi:hypothetical protein|tara:strand:+ start:871 stop:1209 length:339 start_codon:yes stop_codon:yes gene_type:complete
MAKKKNARVRKSDTSKWSAPNPNVKVTSPHVTLSIPRGKCPVELSGNDRPSIREWVIKLTNKKPENCVYLSSVYKYWVRDFYESYSQEYKDIGDVIDTMVIGKISKASDIGA